MIFVELSKGGSAAFVTEMIRRLAQAAVAAGRGNCVGCEDVTAHLEQATGGARIGRRIVGLPPARAGRQAAPVDECLPGL